MIRVCMFCERVFGEKEPLYDKTPTHGICDPCFKDFRMKHEKQEIVEQNAPNWRPIQIKLAYSRRASPKEIEIDLQKVKNVQPSAG